MAETMLAPPPEMDIHPDDIRRAEEIHTNGPIAFNENRASFVCPICGRNYSVVIRIWDGELVRCRCGYRAA